MRTTGLGLMLAMMMTTGCKGPGSWEGIWMVQLPYAEDDECLPDIKENYKDASEADEEDEEEGDFTEETTTKVSDSVFFVQVLEQGGQVYVIWDDTPYVGTVEGKTLTASWTTSVKNETVAEHVEGYDYTFDESSESTTTLTFTRGEKGVVTGTVETKTKATFEWVEDDEWDAGNVGFQSGRIPAGSWLVNDDPGGTQNTADGDECDGGECELEVTYDCKDSVDVQVFYAGDHDEGMYNSLEDANRGYGGGGSLPDGGGNGGGNNGGGNNGGGNGGTNGGGTPGGDVYTDACQVSADCAASSGTYVDVQQCIDDSAVAVAEAQASGCGSEFDDYLECFAYDGVCDTETGVVGGCDTEVDRYVECIIG